MQEVPIHQSDAITSFKKAGAARPFLNAILCLSVVGYANFSWLSYVKERHDSRPKRETVDDMLARLKIERDLLETYERVVDSQSGNSVPGR